MPATLVTSERGDGWAIVSLSSPAGLNKLGSDTLVSLQDEIRLNLSEKPRCLAITGKGDSFAVGADLREIGELTPASAREFSGLGNSIFRTLENTDTVVVTGIDGFCLGGGLDLALAADWRIATTRSIFGHPGSDLGLITGFGGTQRLGRLIGTRKAGKWLYTAERISASEAYAVGLLQEISSEEEFRETLMNRIRTFAGYSPDRVRGMKRMFRYHSDCWPESGKTYAGT